MDIFDVIYNCRSMRRLDEKPVPTELLVELVGAANQAPSGSNMQMARWLVVTDADVKKDLAELNRKGVESYIGPKETRPDALAHQSKEHFLAAHFRAAASQAPGGRGDRLANTSSLSSVQSTIPKK